MTANYEAIRGLVAELRERLAHIEAALEQDVGRSPDGNRGDEIDLDAVVREASSSGRSTLDTKGSTR